MFNSICIFENWLLCFVCEYRDIGFKLQDKTKSQNTYSFNTRTNTMNDWRFNYILYSTNSSEKYKLYEPYTAMFKYETDQKNNIWLRRLTNLISHWLNSYNISLESIVGFVIKPYISKYAI